MAQQQQQIIKEWDVVVAKRLDLYDGRVREVIVIGNAMVNPPPNPITDNKIYIWVRLYFDTEYNFLSVASGDILDCKQFWRADIITCRPYLKELKATVLRKQLGCIFTNMPLDIAEGLASYLI